MYLIERANLVGLTADATEGGLHVRAGKGGKKSLHGYTFCLRASWYGLIIVTVRPCSVTMIGEIDADEYWS